MTATAVQMKQSPWWVLLIKGILAFIVGAILLWSPAKTKIDTWMLLITILGIWWLVSGIVDIVSMFTDHTAWGWKLFTGIVSIIAGGYILMYPIASALALPRIFVLVMGFWAFMQGIVLLFMAFRGGGWGGRDCRCPGDHPGHHPDRELLHPGNGLDLHLDRGNLGRGWRCHHGHPGVPAKEGLSAGW